MAFYTLHCCICCDHWSSPSKDAMNGAAPVSTSHVWCSWSYLDLVLEHMSWQGTLWHSFAESLSSIESPHKLPQI